jgi:hypothetical protein
MLVQFLDHQAPPFSAETFLRKIPAAASHRSESEHGQKTYHANEDPSRKRARPMRIGN